MELLLNVVWALCAASLFLWWALAGRRTSPSRRFLAGALTLLGVALLLFPTISITDDLNPSMLYADDTSVVKRMARSSLAVQQQITPQGLPAIASIALRMPVPRRLEYIGVEQSHLSVPASQASPLAGRSPPSRLA